MTEAWNCILLLSEGTILSWIVGTIALFAFTIACWVHIFVLRRWRRAGKALGFTCHECLFMKSLTGRVDSYHVRIAPVDRNGRYEVDLDSRSAIPRSLSLAAGGILTRPFGKADVEVGDPEFDRLVHIRGVPEQALAVLDHATRIRVREDVVRAGARVNDGHIRLFWHTISAAPILVERLADLARRLSVNPGEIPPRLARNALSDPLPGVRLRNLRLLQEKYPSLPQTWETSRSALASDDAAIRLAAARFLGWDGLPVAEELILSDSVERDIRTLALQFFLERERAERAAPLLEKLAGVAPAYLLPQLIEGLRRSGLRGTLSLLGDRIGEFMDEAAIGFAGAVGELGMPEAEASILPLLARPSQSVRLEAVRALGRMGSTTAVEPLLKLTQGFSTSGALKAAAREAMVQIQSRLGDAEAGRLSLVVPAEEAGSLSLAGAAPEPAGELSLLEREPAPPEPEISN